MRPDLMPKPQRWRGHENPLLPGMPEGSVPGGEGLQDLFKEGFYFVAGGEAVSAVKLSAFFELGAASEAGPLTRIYSTDAEGGGVATISLADAEAAASAAGIDMRMFKLEYEAGKHYGFISQTGSGALWRAADV